ncbi:MAG: DNA alkylation repair protein [Chloroflexota bacterium]|jgi:hypothetical protein
MNSRQADALGGRLADRLAKDDVVGAYGLLKPILEQRTLFRMLDRMAAAAGPCPWPQTITFLDQAAAAAHEGRWVIIGALLWQQYPGRPAATISECRRYIMAADSWYGADILGERVPGPALVEDFVSAQDLLVSWRGDPNRWVRRALGVAVHFWAKRSRGDEALESQAQTLLDFLTPMFEEWEMDAAKGIGWALKTLGKHYPGQLTRWLVAQSGRSHRRLLLRKAMTYLPEWERRVISKAYSL